MGIIIDSKFTVSYFGFRVECWMFIVWCSVLRAAQAEGFATADFACGAKSREVGPLRERSRCSGPPGENSENKVLPPSIEPWPFMAFAVKCKSGLVINIFL